MIFGSRRFGLRCPRHQPELDQVPMAVRRFLKLSERVLS